MTMTEEKALNELLGMSEEELEDRAQAYENDEIEFDEDDELREGSPLDGAGSRREVFVMEAADYRGVLQAVQRDGSSRSDVYLAALREYLERRGLAHA